MCVPPHPPLHLQDLNIPPMEPLGCSWPTFSQASNSPSGVYRCLLVVWAGVHLSNVMIVSEFHTRVAFTDFTVISLNSVGS